MNKRFKFKKTEVGMIPEEWDIVSLKDVGRITTGKTPPTNRKEYWNGDIPFITPSDIKTFNVKTDYITERFLNKKWTEQNYRNLLKRGSICFVCIGSTIGKICMVKTDSYTNQQINSITCIADCESDYLYYQLKNKQYEIKKRLGGSGAVKEIISKSTFEKLKVILPPLSEQKSIAKILSDLDAKIENNNKMNKTLEQIAQAIFKRWFIDFEFPIEIQNLPSPLGPLSQWERGKDGKRGRDFNKGEGELKDVLCSPGYKSSGGKMVKSELGMIPEGWKAGRLGDIIENFDSKRVPLSSQERALKKGIYPYYGATSVMDYIDEYIFDGTYLLMGEDGSVITEKGYPFLQYVWGKFWVNNHAHVLKGKNGISTEYIYLLLKKTNIAHIVTGAVQPKINQGNMNDIKVVIPKSEMLTLFNKMVLNVFEIYKNNKSQNQTLSQIRDSLLPRLMSGKIRVK